MNFNGNFIRPIVLTATGIAVIISVAASSCNNKQQAALTYTGNVITDGNMLVQRYCASCHKLVPANALTKDVWQYHIMPEMAKYLHISTYGTSYFKDTNDTAGVSIADWQRMVSYYQAAAPQELAKAKPPVSSVNDWAGFTLKQPAPVTDKVFTTMAAVSPYNHKIYTSDLGTKKLTEWNNQLSPRFVADLPTTGVDALFLKANNQAIIASVGLIEPADFPDGKLTQVNLTPGAPELPQPIAGDLPRPVQTLEADFNKDGLTDYAVLGQGGKKGGVYLLTQAADHTYHKQQVSEMPGAVQAVTGDFNGDGWPDMMILFGVNNEGLYLFTNNKNGQFSVRPLLQYPPVYGSSSFQLADMNHDGKPDLIYTAGYNFHNSRILKPYHGLYIYINEGNWKFKQRYFYPINGCTKAIAADFDGDGDTDIATIAFFADMKNNPAEEFIYFEQNKPFDFKPHAVPVSKSGRWMSMDVNDINSDGKPDIVLGNYSTGFLFQPDFYPFWNKYIPFTVLENHTIKSVKQ